MTFPRLKGSDQFRNILVDWFSARFVVKYDAGNAEHGPPALYEKPQPLAELEMEQLDSWSYLGAARYQWSRVESILEDGIRESSSEEECRGVMARALELLRTGNDLPGDA